MSTKIDPKLMRDLEQFGLRDAKKCYHCGNCTATCPLSTPDNQFPRKLIRYAQLGLKDEIEKSAEPWLCYYCGDCSVKCPRGADPGEAMMAMRRYLTSRYDWTGFSRRFYTSEIFEVVAVLVVALLVGAGLYYFHAPTPNLEHAHLNSVWPAESLEIADLTMFAVLSILLLSNTWRCVRFVMGDLLSKVPLGVYLGEAKELVVHFLTQKKFAECEDRTSWTVHLLIMTGYSIIFFLVVVLLAGGIKLVGLAWEPIAFQRDVVYPLIHPVRLLGYYATFAIMYGTTYAIIQRLKKKKPQYKHSHSTDWMFLILLQATTVTGIVVHFTRLLDLPMVTYVLYTVHLMVAVPMLVLEVPFAKWAHLAYRPVVLYLTGVKEAYAKSQTAQTAESASPAS